MSKPKSASRARQGYQFIQAHRSRDSVKVMCEVLDEARSGYYEWLNPPSRIGRRKMPDCCD